MNIINRIRPIRRLPHKISYRINRDILKRKSLIGKVFDFKLEIPLQEKGIGRSLYYYGERELDQYSIIKSVLKEGDVVLDIGANIGYYCVMQALHIGPSGFVYAFEPDHRNLPYLRRNLGLNGCVDRVAIKQNAIADFTGSTTFHLAEHANLNSIEQTRGNEHESLVRRSMHNRAYVGDIDVETIELGEVLQSLERRVDLIRMDLEGYEVQILSSLVRAAEQTLNKDNLPRAIVFEPHIWEYTDDHDLKPILVDLQAAGYRVTQIGTRNERASPMKEFGYEPYAVFKEIRGPSQGVYRDINQEDAIELVSRVDGITTACIELIE